MNFLESVGLLAILIVVYIGYLSQNKVRLPSRLEGALILLVLFAAYMIIANTWSAAVSFFSPSSTNTPTPTSTNTPTPTSTNTPTPTSTPSCLLWSKVTPSMEGQTVCVHGVIKEYKEKVGNFYFNFYFGTNEQFYLVSNNLSSIPLKGSCMSSTGRVQLTAEHIPFMEITSFQFC
ncbi:MAG: hypothetical protein IPM31_13400 [Anaerolineae bacterium]|nr:hypothetical protein [Anaerolineae bacterium]MBL8106155.1 hypothetical protein [Anaerolineales bacterium]